MSGRQGRSFLACLNCKSEFDCGPYLSGCPACSTDRDRHVLEVRYDLETLRATRVMAEWEKRPFGLWSYRELLPLPPEIEPVTLFEGGTPLIRVETNGPGRIWIKDETRNPTQAHKDRFHSVSVSMAKHLGFTKVTAATTGNHGTSLAAYAAKASQRSLIFHDPRSPRVLRDLCQLFGASVVVTEARLALLAWMVQERSWYPSTGLTPGPIATPYGIEGYKSIAIETALQLGGRVPTRFYVPVAQGDILYGIWKGFRELAQISPGMPASTKMYAVQSTGCAPIVQAFKDGLNRIPLHPHPNTVALSIGDATGAAVTLSALRDSQGGACEVPDAEILRAVRTLARIGVAAEPSAAAALAAALRSQEDGAFDADEDIVCLVTGAAVKWPETIALSYEPHCLQENDTKALMAWIRSIDSE